MNLLLALLLLAPQDSYKKAVESITEAEVESHVTYLASDEMGGRETGSEELVKAAEYVAGRFKAAGLKAIGDDGTYLTWWEYEGKKTPNCIGLLEGRDRKLKGEYIYIAAHMDGLGRWGDAVFNGADDNASGTAGVIELAEAFAALKKRPKRSIVFMTFSGEEQGFAGSAAYVNAPKFSMDKSAAMINLDMIGRSKDKYLFVGGVGTSSVWSDLIKKHNETYEFQLETGNGGRGPGDNRSFYDKGVPVLSFFTNVHPDYHRPGDDANKIDAKTEAEILKMAFEIVHEVAEAEDRPDFRRNSASAVPRDFYSKLAGGTPPPPRPKVRLGVNVDELKKGLKLTSVQNGSAADRAGLKVGDIVTQIGADKVNTIGKILTALAKLKPGDKVKVKYLRDGKPLETEVHFRKR